MKNLPIRRKKRDSISPMESTSSFADATSTRRRRHRLGRNRYHAVPMSSYRDDAFSADSPQQPRKGLFRRVLGGLLLLGAFAILGAIVVAVWTYQSSKSSIPAGEKVKVTIPKGANGSTIAQILYDAGVVSNSTTFRARLRFSGDSANFRAGTYTLVTGSDYNTVVAALTKGPPPPPTWSVIFPEGMRLTEMSDRVQSLFDKTQQTKGNGPQFNGKQYTAAAMKTVIPAYLQAPKDTKTPEGILFPATYELKNSATADELISRQVTAFNKRFADIDMTYAKSRNLTPYDVVIIASMIEREAQLAKERPLVAAVIYNRLKIGMTLGIDATIQYAVDPNTWKKELTVSDLAIDSPYNSRLNAGLPPTPIANPGEASLRAAAAPAKVDYLYYVAKPDGSGAHTFTQSYDEFLAAQ